MIDIRIVIVIFLGGIGLTLARRYNNRGDSAAGAATSFATVIAALSYIAWALNR